MIDIETMRGYVKSIAEIPYEPEKLAPQQAASLAQLRALYRANRRCEGLTRAQMGLIRVYVLLAREQGASIRAIADDWNRSTQWVAEILMRWRFLFAQATRRSDQRRFMTDMRLLETEINRRGSLFSTLQPPVLRVEDIRTLRSESDTAELSSNS